MNKVSNIGLKRIARTMRPLRPGEEKGRPLNYNLLFVFVLNFIILWALSLTILSGHW